MLNTVLINLSRAILTKVKLYVDANVAATYNALSNMNASIENVANSISSKADAGAVDALASNVDAASRSINTINATISAMSESVGLKADLSEVNSLVSAKADASSVTALTALVTNLTENAPETLDTFAEVAAALASAGSDLGLQDLTAQAIEAMVDETWLTVATVNMPSHDGNNTPV